MPRPGGYIVEGEHFVAEHARCRSPPLTTSYSEAESASIKIREQFEQS